MDFVYWTRYSIAMTKWLLDKGDFTLRVDYPLHQNSVVLDIGGYAGIWAQKIKDRYNCYMYIFEPNPKSYKILEEKFQHEPRISIYPFGLADKNKTALLGMDDMGSSIYPGKNIETVAIELKDIKQVVDELDIKEIDLIKINIEGGEYDLMQRMLESGVVKKCKDIQIQFHNFYPRASFLRRKIRHSLSHTHYLTYDYPFVWENWRRLER
jgi:FkbM family methyltransferase